MAESPNGVDRFRFWDYPLVMPEADEPDVNVYDMRLTQHEDGWIYGLFCTERQESVIDARLYHTIKEVKNGQGPPPLRTEQGWLHLAHGVRNTAAGLRYVLYLFMTALDETTTARSSSTMPPPTRACTWPRHP